jgi:hypothetical protein
MVLFCVVGGALFTVSGIQAGHMGSWWLAGTLISAALLPVVRFGPRSAFEKFGVMALALVVVGIWCTVSEGALFYPESRAQLGKSILGGTVFFAIAAAWLAVLGKILKLNEASEQLVETRSAVAETGLVLVAGVSYLVYYYIFGALAFQLYTKQFYPHAAEQVAVLGAWFPVYQWGRGLLMTLAVLPMIATLRMKRWQAALAVGIAVWIVGGGAALLVPNGVMGVAQRWAHIAEIFTQNFSFGVTAVWLLRRKNAAAVSRETLAHA